MKKANTTTFYELTPAEKAEWIKTLEPVATEVSKRVGKDLIAQFRAAAKGTTN